MAVAFLDFERLHQNEFQKQVIDRFTEIVKTNAFVEGKYNAMFEKEFANMQNTKHCLLVANGTDALEISLKVSGVQTGDKVGVPGITFYASAEAIVNVGAIPVLIDVDPLSGLISPSSLKNVLENHRLKAVMPVHIYGLPAPIGEIKHIVKDLDIAIIEDGAQACGTILDSGPCGSSGNLTTFSFYPTKNLAAFGDAGAILTNDDSKVEMIKSIRNHGRGEHPIIGRNSRCDHLQAAVLHAKLETIKNENQKRKEIAKKYHEGLKNFPVHILHDKFIETSSWHLYPVRFNNKDEKQRMQQHLSQKEIGTAPFYDLAMHHFPALMNCEGDKEFAQQFAGTVLCLPMHPHLEDREIAEVIQAIKEFY
ncbi:MAG: DegT/DnrJ/EryC1/StrS family aminotransferase [Halobacteriovoraceae bacterium]|nr:DegT/DnrJ/EryC1/StrS family aminotransferase [Halobacteriovoraceae bacterium]